MKIEDILLRLEQRGYSVQIERHFYTVGIPKQMKQCFHLKCKNVGIIGKGDTLDDAVLDMISNLISYLPQDCLNEKR